MMAYRWVAACGIGLLTALHAAAQTAPASPVAPAGPDCLDQPTQPPLLLKPPSSKPSIPLAEVPRGPVGEYDHGQFYLPDYVPSEAPESCRPMGRWWVSPSLELGWISTRPAASTVRLRVPDGMGGSIPGPIIPVAGRSSDTFQAGFGLNLGFWLDDNNKHGFDASLYLLDGGDHTFAGFAPSMLVLFPDGTNRSTPQLVVFPPGTPVVGIFPVTLSTWFITTDVNYRHNLYCDSNVRLDGLVGYRYAFLQDELFIGESPDGSDDKHTRNRIAVSNSFNGGQIGLAGEYQADRWYVSGTAKVAFGVVTSDVSATGLFEGAEGATPGGFARLAALADGGHSQFAVLPSMNVTLGRQLGQHCRLFVGYSFYYLSQVARIGDVLNTSAGTTAPTTNFWAQSISLGFELRY